MGPEKVLQENFLPSNLFGKSKTLPPVEVALSTFIVKKLCLGIYNPMASAEEKYTSLICTSYKLIDAFKGKKEFSTADHIWAVDKV